ncbi:MAG: TlpA family protein disulfide reductase, partial [Silvanigrellaceae bacterium]|nr:TlpA family protein disulfide reductase [Silvanigrellaceae bacterium]
AILLKYPVVKKYETMLKLYNTGKNDSLKLQLNQQLQNMRDSIENYNRALKLATIQWIETMPHSYISATELYSLMINQQLGTIEANRLFHHLTDPVQQSRVGQLIAATLQKSMVNIKAPDFKAKDFNQENFQLNSLIGKYIVISFWASWCIPCIQEIPDLKQMYKRYHSKGLEIVSISIDEDSLAWYNAVKKWNLENWKNILCNTAIKSSYINPNMPIPSLLLINDKGMIIWNSINTAEVNRIMALEKELSNLLIKK